MRRFPNESVKHLIGVFVLFCLVFTFLAWPAPAVAANKWNDMQGPGDGDAPRVVWDEGNTTLYRATQMRGVFKYKNGQWTSLGGWIGDKTIRSLALDERNPASTNLYVGTHCFGTGPGYGVWRCATPDATPTWTKISSPTDVGDLKIQSLYYESVTNILYVGIDGGAGVWRCTNPDDSPTPHTWTKISSSADVGDRNVRSFAYDGGPTHRLYVGVETASHDGGVWRCDNPDGVSTWTKISVSTDMRDAAEALCYHHGKLYGALSGKGLWRCDNPDGAYVWDKISGQDTIGELDNYALYYYDGASDYLYTVGGYGAWRCSNPDATGPTNSWTKISPWDYSQMRVCTSMAFDYNSNEIWVGTASYGVYKVIYLDANVQWLNTGGGLSNDNVSAFYYDTTRDILYASSNSGFWRCRNPGTTQTWEQADGPAGRITYDSAHNIIYVGTWGSGVW